MQCVKIGGVPAGNETRSSQEHFLGCLFLSLDVFTDLHVELPGLAHLLKPRDLQRERGRYRETLTQTADAAGY